MNSGYEVNSRRKKSLKKALSFPNNTHRAVNLSLSSRYDKPANSLTLLFLSCFFVSFIVGVQLVAIVDFYGHIFRNMIGGML